MQISFTGLLLMAFLAQAGSEPLRGAYTFGHEVNSFCPEKNSQCYWLGPNSSPDARAQLRQIYEDKKPACISRFAWCWKVRSTAIRPATDSPLTMTDSSR